MSYDKFNKCKCCGHSARIENEIAQGMSTRINELLNEKDVLRQEMQAKVVELVVSRRKDIIEAITRWREGDENMEPEDVADSMLRDKAEGEDS